MNIRNIKILIIDDDVNLCTVVAHQLEQMGYGVLVAHTGKSGIEEFKNSAPELLLIDLQMPDIHGMEVLKEIRAINQDVAIIIITAYGTVENAIDACNLGADDYLTKPFAKEQLRFAIEKAYRFKIIERENQQLRQEIASKYSFEGIITQNKEMRNLLELAKRAARSDTTVLILGESGTGKELLAKAIHQISPRKNGPFVTVNCPSIPENLMESELFGHEKGAFTGAISARSGKFELAYGGTIFLDEVADLKFELQSKLLRVLQEHEIEHVGGRKLIPVDVRVIAATNRELSRAVQNGDFREDLFYRLNVIPLKIPPLRDRKEDLPILVEYFVQKHSPAQRFVIKPDFMRTLMKLNWPGNVRELENVIERSIVLCPNNELTASCIEDLTQINKPATREAVSEPSSLSEIERQAIIAALKENNWNQTKASQQLQIPRHVLIYRMKKFGIVPDNPA